MENHSDARKGAVVSKLLVDTGSEFTWLPGEVLARIGVEPVKKDLQIQMANGQIVTRSVGFAILRVDKFFTIDEVVFAQRGDLSLLGSRALEGMNIQVDARRKKLVGAGPVVAATAIRPEVAKALGIVVQSHATNKRARHHEISEEGRMEQAAKIRINFPTARAAGFDYKSNNQTKQTKIWH